MNYTFQLRAEVTTLLRTAMLAWLLLAAGCDRAATHAFRNGLSTPLEIAVTFEGNEFRFIGKIEPGKNFVFGRPMGPIATVVISSAGLELYRLNQRDLVEMSGSAPRNKAILWNIEPDGIKPISARDTTTLLSLGVAPSLGDHPGAA